MTLVEAVLVVLGFLAGLKILLSLLPALPLGLVSSIGFIGGLIKGGLGLFSFDSRVQARFTWLVALTAAWMMVKLVIWILHKVRGTASA